jgi:Flp pilus assembly pilin Flp
MTRIDLKTMRRFFRDESGATNLIPFALWVPLFLGVIVAGVEMGALSVRHTQLERGLDVTVREVRLGTGESIDHGTLKAMVCANAPILSDCENMLRLEMIPLSLWDWLEPARIADCEDLSQPVRPLRQFTSGDPNELMFLRACYKYKPIVPTGALAGAFARDGEGYTALVSFAAFVQEPF